MPDSTVNFTLQSDVCMPAGISALTSLSWLVLGLGKYAGLFDLAPLHALPLLQGLHVVFAGASLECSAGLSSLQKLTSLILVGPDSIPDDHPVVQVNLDVEWSSMPALQHLVLDSLSVNCNSSILELTALHNLSDFVFYNSRPVQSSANLLCHLMYRLARYCPHVKLTVHSHLYFD